MVEKPVLNKKGRFTDQRKIRLVWNNALRVNHQNKLTHPHPKRKFVPTAVLTNSGQVPVNVVKQSSSRAAASISTARLVNTAAPKSKVNDALPIIYSYFKAHSPVKRAFNQKSAAKTNNFNEKVNTARVNNVTTAGPKAVVSAAKGNEENAIKSSACWIWRPTGNVIDHTSKDSRSYMLKRFNYVDLQGRLKHMTGNKSFLTDYQEIDGGFVAFGGSPKGGKITGKGKIRTGKLDFEDVYFVKELKFNLFSVSQMCDKKNSVLFTKTECLVLSPDFKLLDESQVLLKVPRHDNMYSFDLNNVVPLGGLTCLFAKATIDESNIWHRRLGHINFKIKNKFMRGNLVRGLPSKLFENDHTFVACQKRKQHKASCKTKLVSSISQPLQMLHMDLFGPTSVRSINHKTYCLVVTDDFSRFSWVFFLATKDETSGILKTFITGIENQMNHQQDISPTKDPTPRQGKRGRDTKIPQSGGLPKKVGDEAVYIGEDDRVVRATTTATSLEAEQESGNIHKTRSTATLNEPSPQEQETDQQADPRSQYTILGMHDAQLIKILYHQHPHDSPLSGGHILECDEGRPNINESMAICTKLSNRVLALETSKTAQDLVIKKLKKKLKRLEKKLRARTPGMKLFKIGTSRRKSLEKENAVSAASAIILVLVYRISNAEQEKPPQQTTTAFEKMRILLLLKHFPSKNDAISVAPQYSRRNKETVSIDEQARFLVETVAKRKSFLMLMDTGSAVHMMVEKKYHLTQEMLSRMLNRRLEVDHESIMAFELLRFIKAQLEETMFEEGDFDDDFDDINDMVNEEMENVEGDTVNNSGVVNTATTGVSVASASVTTAGVSISIAKPRTPPTTTTTAFEDEDLTIIQTLVKMRSQKDKEKEKGVTFRAAQEESARPTRILSTARPTRILLTIDPKDKGKGIMQEPEKPPRTQERLRFRCMKSWL
ncbi:ribonuclease H-like domain-containing protein [Tanacetum coccineum]